MTPVMYSDISGEFPILTILTITAIGGLVLTIRGVATDNNAKTAIGLTMVAVPALIAGGMALAGGIAGGATLTAWVGGGTMIAGAGTGLFASAEYQEHFTNNNWIQDSTGMSDGLYNGLMIGVATIATLGNAASSIGYSYNINSIQGFGKYGNYYGMRFDTGAGRTRVLEFQTHGHGKGFSQWHFQEKGFNPFTGTSKGTIGRWTWWKIWNWG